MSFPVSSCGTVSAYQTDLARAVASAQAMIRAEEPSSLSVTADRIEFSADTVYGISKSFVLGALDSGTVAFRRADVRIDAHYYLSFRRSLLQSIFLVVLGFGLLPVLFLGWHPAALLFIFGAWVFLFGGNYLTTTTRFRAALRRALAEARSETFSGATRGI